jgi:hypothetical protein
MPRCLVSLLTFLLLLPAAGAYPVRLSNGLLEVGLDPEDGSLVELRDLQTKHNHASPVPKQGGLWQLELKQSGTSRTVSATNAKSFHCERLPDAPAGLLLVWEDFGLPTAPELRARATVRLEDGAPMSEWELTVGGISPSALGKVHFPRLAGIAQQPSEALAVPVWLGQQTTEPRKLLSGPDGRGQRLEWTYPGLLSVQCVAFYQPGGPGLYFACDDTAAFVKTFAFFGDARGDVGCEAVHLPEADRTDAHHWSLPYHVLLGTFQGDWVTAAERYRAWATNQVWAKESRLARGEMPDWVLNTGMWVWNRGRSEGVLPPAEALQKKLRLPVSVFWHWWHGCAYDAGFPEYLPPREGTGPFKAALAGAHKQGLHALVYMNQRLWGMTTRSWSEEGAERFAVKGPDGKVHPEIYNTFTRTPCASMCMGTEFWRDKYAGLAEQAVRELGVDGIYMDQACTSLACYDPTHGHPVGGGTYWMKGFQALAGDIRRRCGESDSGAAEPTPRAARAAVVLAGEGCGEPWLPCLDLMLSLQVSRERYSAPDDWETIPFFQAVYHPCAVTYGNYSSLTMPPYDDLWPAQFAPAEPLKLLDRKFSQQFCLEQARAFVWGQQPTIANFLPSQLKQRREEIDYAMQLARIRSRAKKYLLYGTLLRPPELHAPEAVLDISRLSIYAGQQGALTSSQKRCPLVLAGAWRAPDGELGIALASIADKPLEISFTLDPAYYGLPKRATLYRTDQSRRKSLGRLGDGASDVKLKLAPRGACMLEFAGSG